MAPARILLVDDDKNHLRVLTYHIEESGFEAVPCSNPRKALNKLSEETFDLVITDLRMPEMDGLELIRRIRGEDTSLPIIVLTAYGSIDKAVEAVKGGASDFLSKPFEKAEVEHAIAKALKVADLLEENRRLAQAVQEKFEFAGIQGSSKKFSEVLEMAAQLARVQTTVLIQGESGTGKELLARAIHFNSPRKQRPFVVVNCGAIPEDLMESELFGHAKGAFTGAIARKKGKFEIADTGSILLDEIGELPPNMQVKILRALQEKEIDIVGDPHPKSVDVRILAATNRDLKQLMDEGRFREDLYYRLAVAPLQVPPLRQRKEDIPILAHHFLTEQIEKTGSSVTLDSSALEAMQEYDWPGNVRELENVIERLVIFNRSGTISREDLPSQFGRTVVGLQEINLQLPENGFSLEELEKNILHAALEHNDWNQSQTARYLGITRNTLVYRMQKFGLKEKA